MLLARKAARRTKDGIHHNGEIYFADELWGWPARRSRSRHAARPPVDRVFHHGRWLATGYPSSELDEGTLRVPALERRREDEKALHAWARRARRTRADCGSRRSPRRAGSTSFPRPRHARTAPGLQTGDVAAAGPGRAGQPSP